MAPLSLLKQCFFDLVKCANAQAALAESMPTPPGGKTYVLAIGKAAAAMAQAFEARWPNDAPLAGIALTPYQHGVNCQYIEVVEASHPVPDAVGLATARRIVADVQALGEHDLLVCLISGGGSALFCLPVDAITLAEKQQVNRQLLAAGVPIDQMNCVRKHISAVKGGRLAAMAHPASIHTVAISDVPGNALSTIASGPTVPDLTTRQQALAITRALPSPPPSSVIDWLNKPSSETPKALAGSARHWHGVTVTPETAFAGMIKGLGDFDLRYLGADLQGAAQELGQAHAAMAKQIAATLSPHARPVLILSGGETTVTLTCNRHQTTLGRGGRNCEYLLSLFACLGGQSGVYALAADSDGIDGSEDNAGAYFGPKDWERAQAVGLDPQHFLARHDSYSLFDALGLLLKTGPTRTNVNDFRAILVLPPGV